MASHDASSASEVPVMSRRATLKQCCSTVPLAQHLGNTMVSRTSLRHRRTRARFNGLSGIVCKKLLEQNCYNSLRVPWYIP